MKLGVYTLIIEGIFSNMPEYSFMLKYGWGNGYVLLPYNHPLYGVDYDDLNIRVHGGLTFGSKFESNNFLKWVEDREFYGDVTSENFEKFNNYWMIGFDTNHFGDNSETCSKEYVISESDCMLDQCLDD